jgi:hypothetical protein
MAYELVTPPMDVRVYSQILLTGWRSAGIGVIPAVVEFVVDQSSDLEVWHVGTAFSPASPGAEVSHAEWLNFPWIRVRAVLTGADPGATCWLTAELVRRDGVD